LGRWLSFAPVGRADLRRGGVGGVGEGEPGAAGASNTVLTSGTAARQRRCGRHAAGLRAGEWASTEVFAAPENRLGRHRHDC